MASPQSSMAQLPGDLRIYLGGSPEGRGDFFQIDPSRDLAGSQDNTSNRGTAVQLQIRELPKISGNGPEAAAPVSSANQLNNYRVRGRRYIVGVPEPVQKR
jgi:hypothetical protein